MIKNKNAILRYKCYDDKSQNVIKTKVRNLNLQYVKPQRAGVIMYTYENGVMYIGMGLDANTHDLTDFGGGVMYKNGDDNVIKGGLREFEEETLGIFTSLSIDDVKECPVIYDDNNLIIFINVGISPNQISKKFNETYEKEIGLINHKSDKFSLFNELNNFQNQIKDPEVCGITWLTWGEFRKEINNGGIIFKRVQHFLYRAKDFSYLL